MKSRTFVFKFIPIFCSLGLVGLGILASPSTPSYSATPEITDVVSAPSSSLIGPQPVVPTTENLTIRIGVAAAVKGTVQAVLPGQTARSLKSGSSIFQGDKISTGPDTHMQILLQDETTVTVGVNSTIVMDEFIYDPKTDAGKVSASVAKGVFRFVTGKVAHKNPKKMKVKLPVGTIGIRGTVFAVQTDGLQSQVVLLGPGQDNNAGERAGAIYVETEGGSVDVTRVGYGTEVAEYPAQAPAEAEPVPQEEMDALYEALEVTPEEEGEKLVEGEGLEENSGKSADGEATTQDQEEYSEEKAARDTREQDAEQDIDKGAADPIDDAAYGTADVGQLESLDIEEDWAKDMMDSAIEETHGDLFDISEIVQDFELIGEISEELTEETDDSAQDSVHSESEQNKTQHSGSSM